MSLLTPFLKLFKWDTTNEIDLESEFNIDKSMNENWDKLDTKAQEHENKILDIENNIENIQTKDTEQDKLIQKLQANAINESTEEATSLYVEDASDLPAVLSVRGNHYQETQEGTSNLAILQEGTIEQNGNKVVVENGIATLSGTNSSDTTNYVKVGTAYLYSGKTYYINNIRTLNMGSHGALLRSKTGAVKWFTANTELEWECTNTSEWDIEISYSAGQYANGTEKFLISETSGAEWIQGKKAIPSLEYPSEISTVKSEMNVVVSNKNLYKITASDNNYNGIKLTVNQEEGYATATGTSTGYSHPIGTVVLKPGDYVFSGGPKNGDWNKARLSIYVKNTEGVFESITTIYKDTTYSVHLDKETEYRLNYVITSGTTVTDEKIYPQVEKGTVATDFVKHEEKEYNLAVQKNMLQNDYFDTEKESIDIAFKTIGAVEPKDARVMIIDNTLNIGTLLVSESIYNDIKDKVELLEDNVSIEFNEDGTLK